ncbi:hypothetical protein EGI11_06775 [Chryseobacterium sp. H3056]|uniref:Uncharacterized protein n=1 Tax=Kaistella daneshvariae TaxID=2487074 RepID=A0A3N0WYN6_9FLAO|nr:hypothetical protein EGI11_06775 [Kaistella daneshvariae]
MSALYLKTKAGEPFGKVTLLPLNSEIIDGSPVGKTSLKSAFSALVIEESDESKVFCTVSFTLFCAVSLILSVVWVIFSLIFSSTFAHEITNDALSANNKYFFINNFKINFR